MKLFPYKVSILIPHFNDPDGLLKTLSSIRCQREKIVVIVIDDGSDEPIDPRDLEYVLDDNIDLRLLELGYNMGIESALNIGLYRVQQEQLSEYVARLDCGDSCTIDRFDLQIAYLNAHPSVSLVGAWADFQDKEGNYLFTFKAPSEHEAIRRQMTFRNCFVHSSIMFRSSILPTIGYYPSDYEAAEDYAYFFRVLKRFSTAIIDKVLINKEVDPDSISVKKRKKQAISRIRVIRDHVPFGFRFVKGLVWASILLLIPIQSLTFVKRIIWK